MEYSYKIVFDVTNSPPPNIAAVLLVGAFLSLIGLVPFTIRKYRPTSLALVLQIVVAGLGLLLLVAPIITQQKFNEFVRAYREGRYKVVEGAVQNLRPMPANFRAVESFTVGEQRFTYNDFRMTPGFHHSRAAGGPIRPGMKVRIHYIGNDIARLEILEGTGPK